MKACKYVFDSSALLEPWNHHYPPDVFPQLWESLEDLISRGLIRAPYEVRRELERKSDKVFEWADRQSGLFVDVDEDQLLIVAAIVNAHPDLVGPNSQRSQADPFVIAMGEHHGLPVVTYETRAKVGAAPKIQNVCDARKVDRVPFVDVLRAEKVKF